MLLTFTENNLNKTINFDLQSKSKNKKKILIFSKFVSSSMVFRFLLILLNLKRIKYKSFYISSQFEINCVLKNLKKNPLVIVFLGFGNDIHLGSFFYLNYHFIKKILVIDFYKWILTENIKIPFVFFIFELLTDEKYLKYFYSFEFREKTQTVKQHTSSLIAKINFDFFSKKIWKILIYGANIYLSFNVDRKLYRSFLFSVSKKLLKKLKYKPKLSGGIFFQMILVKNYIKKTIDMSLLFFRHSSVLESLTRTPSFFIKFYLWKYRGVSELLKFFLKLEISFYIFKVSWIHLKNNWKKKFKRNINKEMVFQKTYILRYNSFIKIYYFKENTNSKNFIKVSIDDLLYGKKTTKQLYYENFKPKTIISSIKYAQNLQNFLINIVSQIICKKNYMCEVFFRCCFLVNSKNTRLEKSIVKNIALYSMLTFCQHFKSRKDFFIITCMKNQKIMVCSFFKYKNFKIIKEKFNIIENNNGFGKILVLILKKKKEIKTVRKISFLLRDCKPYPAHTE